jgi:hypothetical protein
VIRSARTLPLVFAADALMVQHVGCTRRSFAGLPFVATLYRPRARKMYNSKERDNDGVGFA